MRRCEFTQRGQNQLLSQTIWLSFVYRSCCQPNLYEVWQISTILSAITGFRFDNCLSSIGEDVNCLKMWMADKMAGFAKLVPHSFSLVKSKVINNNSSHQVVARCLLPRAGGQKLGGARQKKQTSGWTRHLLAIDQPQNPGFTTPADSQVPCRASNWSSWAFQRFARSRPRSPLLFGSWPINIPQGHDKSHPWGWKIDLVGTSKSAWGKGTTLKQFFLIASDWSSFPVVCHESINSMTGLLESMLRIAAPRSYLLLSLWSVGTLSRQCRWRSLGHGTSWTSQSCRFDVANIKART